MMPVGFCNPASPSSLLAAQEKSHSRTKRKLQKNALHSVAKTEGHFAPLKVRGSVSWPSSLLMLVLSMGHWQRRTYCLTPQLCQNGATSRALDLKQLAEEAPTVSETIEATKALVKYVKKTGNVALLSKTVNQMGDTRFSTVYLTMNSVRSVYQELLRRVGKSTFGKCRVLHSESCEMSWAGGENTI